MRNIFKGKVVDSQKYKTKSPEVVEKFDVEKWIH